ncbi:MAG: YitT family protein [Bacteroidales bacterium]|jgi:uncharacterized membrane-anchored protein YitT (DUF2179 family)|nr:YitT family protein [Bacteroidales bacterium]
MKPLLTKQQLYREIKSYTIITLCLCAYAFALVGFIINAEIVGGGVNGLCTLLYYASGKTIQVGISSFIINAILLAIGFKILGNRFGVKTIYAIFMLSFFIGIWQNFLHEPFLGDDLFFSAITGGIVSGVAIGTAFNYGGSTGGTDILALIIIKYRNISPGRIILYCDVVIISSSYIVFHYFLGQTTMDSIRIVLYGFVVMAVVSYTVDMVVFGAKQSVQLLILSQKHEEVAEMVSKEIRHGVTFLHGKGYYSKEDREVLLIVVRKYEMQNVLRRIRYIDPNAFISISDASGVYGKGFDNIK